MGAATAVAGRCAACAVGVPLTGLAASAALVGALLVGEAGYAVRYAPGVMSNVAHNRHIAPQPCMVAYTHAVDADMGRLWLWVEGPAVAAECLVVDLPQDVHRPGLVRRGVDVEFDHRSGARVCGRRWRGKASECPIRVRVIRQ